jgi:hypothetical protein
MENSRAASISQTSEVPDRPGTDTETPRVWKGRLGYQLDVEPPGLDGKVMVLVRQSSQGVEAQLDAAREQTHQLLQHNLTAIREHLESKGVDLGELSLGFHEGGQTGGQSASGFAERYSTQQNQEHTPVASNPSRRAAQTNAPTTWDGQVNVLA